ncbi:MAG: hypothetical protein R3B13_39725 [Polyangiaceae bacterium]
MVEAHRDKAPDLFREELRAVAVRLGNSPTAGAQRYMHVRGQLIWRVLMPKTQDFVYFHVDDARSVVGVITLWNAVGEKQPDFST